MGFLTSIAAAATGLGGAPGAQPEMNSLNARNEITIAPVGINIGAIMQPYTENPANGGLGLLSTAPRFSGGNRILAHPAFSAPSKLLSGVKAKLDGGTLTPILVVGGLVAVGAFAVSRIK